MPTLDFYFAPGSRYSYLATCRLPFLEQRYGVEFDWIPVSGPRIRTLRGADPFKGPPVSGQYDWDYRRRDAEAWAAYYGVPYREPVDVHFDGDLLIRAATAAKRLGHGKSYAIALTAEVYAKGSWPLDDALCRRVAQDTGLGKDEFSALLADQGVADEVEQACKRAVDRDVFGVPTCFVGAAMFWGNDRLVLVEEALKNMKRVGPPEEFSGGCACGAVRYVSSCAPVAMVNCHCRDCQRAGGAGYSPTVIIPRSHFQIIEGQPRYFDREAASGAVAQRAFCGDCGSPLFASSSAHPEYMGIRAGSLDDSVWFRPNTDVWTCSAQPWDIMHPDTEKITRSRMR